MTDRYIYLSNLSSSLPELPESTILSQTVLDSEDAKVVLFGFAPGQALSEHTASVPAIIHVLDGTGWIMLDGNQHALHPGAWIYIPPRLDHSLQADGELQILLILLQSARLASE